MDTDQKKYFQALCSTGNITKAAEELYLSRQGLSKSMKNLEEALGATLFIRGKTGVALTEAGYVLQRYTREEDRLWNACLSDILTIGARETELVRVGMQNMYFGYDQKRALLSMFHDDHRINVEVVDGDHDEYWHAIARGDMELAFSLSPLDDIDIPAIRLSTDSLSVLLSKDDPLAQENCVNFQSDLPGKTLIQTSPYKNKRYETICRNFGIKSVLLAPDKNLMLARVATGKDFFIIQTKHARNLVTEQVCMKPLVNSPIAMDSFLVFRPDLSWAGKIVAQELLSAFGKENEFDAFFDTAQ